MLFYDTALVPDLENFRWWKNPLFQTIASLIAVSFLFFPSYLYRWVGLGLLSHDSTLTDTTKWT